VYSNKQTGEILRELRIKMKLTQLQVSNTLKLSPKIISFYESGERFPSKEVLANITKLYGVTPNYVLGIDESEDTDEIRSVARDLWSLDETDRNTVRNLIDRLREKGKK
jgi:transcriptional regulator with XRE-family HTH domain